MGGGLDRLFAKAATTALGWKDSDAKEWLYFDEKLFRILLSTVDPKRQTEALRSALFLLATTLVWTKLLLNFPSPSGGVDLLSLGRWFVEMEEWSVSGSESQQQETRCSCEDGHVPVPLLVAETGGEKSPCDFTADARRSLRELSSRATADGLPKLVLDPLFASVHRVAAGESVPGMVNIWRQLLGEALQDSGWLHWVAERVSPALTAFLTRQRSFRSNVECEPFRVHQEKLLKKMLLPDGSEAEEAAAAAVQGAVGKGPLVGLQNSAWRMRLDGKSGEATLCDFAPGAPLLPPDLMAMVLRGGWEEAKTAVVKVDPSMLRMRGEAATASSLFASCALMAWAHLAPLLPLTSQSALKDLSAGGIVRAIREVVERHVARPEALPDSSLLHEIRRACDQLQQVLESQRSRRTGGTEPRALIEVRTAMKVLRAREYVDAMFGGDRKALFKAASGVKALDRGWRQPGAPGWLHLFHFPSGLATCCVGLDRGAAFALLSSQFPTGRVVVRPGDAVAREVTDLRFREEWVTVALRTSSSGSGRTLRERCCFVESDNGYLWFGKEGTEGKEGKEEETAAAYAKRLREGWAGGVPVGREESAAA